MARESRFHYTMQHVRHGALLPEPSIDQAAPNCRRRPELESARFDHDFLATVDTGARFQHFDE